MLGFSQVFTVLSLMQGCVHPQALSTSGSDSLISLLMCAQLANYSSLLASNPHLSSSGLRALTAGVTGLLHDQVRSQAIHILTRSKVKAEALLLLHSCPLVPIIAEFL